MAQNDQSRQRTTEEEEAEVILGQHENSFTESQPSKRVHAGE